MNSRTRSRRLASMDQTSHREDAPPSPLLTARMTTSCYCWSWRSLHRRTNAGIVGVSAPGDYALFNSNHIPDGTAFRAAHNFRRTIGIPGFHVTTWFDVFQTSVLAAFNDIQSRVGNQKLWIGPNEHYFVYHRNFWPRDPYFAWFDCWLKGEPTGIMDKPAVFYAPRAWIED